MARAETTGLLIKERSERIGFATDIGSQSVEIGPAEETARCPVGDALPDRANSEPHETLPPTNSAPAEAPEPPAKIRGRDLIFVALNASLGWAAFWLLFGLVARFAIGNRTDFDAFAEAASRNFYFNHIADASFYLALLLAIRRMLRKRRGPGSIAAYFCPIGSRRLFYAALSGLLLSALAVLVLAVVSQVAHSQYHPAAAENIIQPHSFDQLMVAGLIFIVLAPLTEEMLFRGLLLEFLRQKLSRLPTAYISAAIFAVGHLRFVQDPGMTGWTATALIAAVGFVCALWAQRTNSLRAAIAVHATYNVPFVLLFCC